MKNIKFIKDAETSIYNPPQYTDTFYQICKFKSPDNTYSVRKVIFNEHYIILKTYEKQYSLKILTKFIKHAPPNKIKIYPIISLGDLCPPNASDLMLVRSSLTNNNPSLSNWQIYN